MHASLLADIRAQSFTPLGWFKPASGDAVPSDVRCVLLIGNAGPDMFRRFESERAADELLDAWTRRAVGRLANAVGARAVYPFDQPPLPFLRWGRRGGAGHVSPLGLNIHPVFGLWHAYRAALFLAAMPDLPRVMETDSPCDTCVAKPCLNTCPVAAFDGRSYDVPRCVHYLESGPGERCMMRGCQARLACPVGREFAYEPAQAQFHMRAFRDSQRRMAG